MDLALKTTHVKEAQARLLEQFRLKQRIRSLVEAIVDPIQELENVSIEVNEGRWLDNATGVQLDAIGAIVGQPRLGFTDPQYKSWIQARVKLNRSNAKADEILEIADLVLDADTEFFLREEYPAGFRVEVYNYAGDFDIVFDILSSAKGAGIRFSLVYAADPGDDIFQFAPGTTVLTGDTAKGFADVDGLTGGRLAGVQTL